MTPAPSVVYVLPDKMGGSLTIIENLLKYRRPDQFQHRVVLTDNRLQHDARFGRALGADVQTTVPYALPLENIHEVARRLMRAIGPGPGVLVCNDAVEMLLLALVDPGRTVIQILHGDYDYYYDMAAAHEGAVHAFVAYSRTVYETLLKRLPHRGESIFWLPYGIPIPSATRRAAPGPLRLIYVGRLDEAKGVFDLPAIDRALGERGVDRRWTVVGRGPAGAGLRARWGDAPGIVWIEAPSSSEVVALLERHDVFVLPTRAEGLSVATVEAMSAGVVPIVTDLLSMRELVDTTTGYRIAEGDVSGFAEAIAVLARDRVHLETLSGAARQRAVDRFDIRERAAAYQALYARYRELYRPRRRDAVRRYGSRLDRPWLPNGAVYAIRRGQRWLRKSYT